MSIEPTFLLSVRPFGQDPLSVTFHVHRVLPREPQFGVFGRPLEPTPAVTLPELLAEMQRAVEGLGRETAPGSAEAEPPFLPVVDGRIVPPEKTT